MSFEKKLWIAVVIVLLAFLFFYPVSLMISSIK